MACCVSNEGQASYTLPDERGNFSDTFREEKTKDKTQRECDVCEKGSRAEAAWPGGTSSYDKRSQRQNSALVAENQISVFLELGRESR